MNCLSQFFELKDGNAVEKIVAQEGPEKSVRVKPKFQLGEKKQGSVKKNNELQDNKTITGATATETIGVNSSAAN